MPVHGRYLRFRHVFPECVAPWISFRRGLLRIRWFCLQQIAIEPIWTTGAMAGLLGVALTVLLFLFSNEDREIAASSPTRASTVENHETPAARMEPIVEAKPSPAPIVPIQQSELAASFQRLTMPLGWDARRIVSSRSVPPSFRPFPGDFRSDDGWQIADLSRSAFHSLLPRYQEPPGLRDWAPANPLLKAMDSVPSDVPISISQHSGLLVEKELPSSATASGMLSYRLTIRNVGSTLLEDVEVQEKLDPQGVIRAVPPARLEPYGLQWNIGVMDVGASRTFEVTVLAPGQGFFEPVTEVHSGGRVSSVSRVQAEPAPPFFGSEPAPEKLPSDAPLPAFPSTSLPPTPLEPSEAGQPILTVKSETAKIARRGSEVVTWYEIANIGTAPAEQVVLTVKLPESLLHHDGKQTVQHTIPILKPGETRRARLVLRADAIGQFTLQGTLTAKGIRETDTARLMVVEQEASLPAVDEFRGAKVNRVRSPIQQCECVTPQRKPPIDDKSPAE